MDTRTLDGALGRAKAKRHLPPPATQRLLRERAGLTQADVAATLGVTREAIAQWESGRRTPRAALVAEYVAILDRLARESLP